MNELTLKKHGTPNWCACATTELSAAETFYQSLFGWESERATAADGTAYSIQRLDEKKVAALYKLNDKLGGMNVPPHWEVYFEVDDVDETVKKVTQADGKIVTHPFEESAVGKIATIQDSVGANLNVWHSAPQYGSQVSGSPGTMTWIELLTKEPGRAAEFYQKVFDLESASMEAQGSYTFLKKEGQEVAGILESKTEMGKLASTWDVYFACDDVDTMVKAVVSAGGAIVREPFDIPAVGARMAVLQDPQGAVFEIIKSGEQEM